MTLNELLKQFQAEPMSPEKTASLLKIVGERYGFQPAGDMLTILELGGTAAFQAKPPLRFLGLDEIIHAEAYLHVDFAGRGLLPLFDLYENDFICYRIQDRQFCVFNIIDYSQFGQSGSVIDVLKKLGYFV
ncbi:hypothetical protein [Paenibacillus spongiae]|uniref:SMI1/KNR4 family protein n=1 Tax=Paenibacillus spongiae TaxID=2909671 RepID=A0ABY5SDF8_9BACL|nr:hypothetical protein [Paenibacillus spongiae]UVI31966.1 hypothetical protein L1F29_09180 [Paenibacillus spongiae]